MLKLSITTHVATLGGFRGAKIHLRPRQATLHWSTKFENGGLALKTHQGFFVRTAQEESKQYVLEENSVSFRRAPFSKPSGATFSNFIAGVM